MTTLTTSRLTLRPWRESDRAPLAAISGDARTMRFFAAARTPAQSDAWMDRTQAHFNRYGFGIWAVELTAEALLIGFVGLSTIPQDTPVPPGVELVWTLGAGWWGRGYAPEAACAAAAHGFAVLRLPELFAFTAAVNGPSRRVMEKIGMVLDPMASFDHPRVPSASVLRRHVLYRLAAPQEAGTMRPSAAS